LEALASQKISAALAVEIVLVDNASTDGTAEYATKTWNSLGARFDLRVVEETVPGLSHARKKGIEEAKFSFILFCDDDNRLESNYVNDTFLILNSDNRIAACGGIGTPVYEAAKPYWFDEYAEAFAVGSQEITEENGKILTLYGAGLAIRKQVLQELDAAGFKQHFKGRLKNKLSSSEDTELTNAMVLLGYKLVYSDKLRFRHYLPKERTTFSYLKKLFIAFGTDGPIRNLYYSFISERRSHKLIQNWNFHLLLSLVRLVKYLVHPPKKFGRSIYFNWSLAYIKELIAVRKYYPEVTKGLRKISEYKINSVYTTQEPFPEVLQSSLF
jgi:glycosyltransferase involved in cell wall biosynthesis